MTCSDKNSKLISILSIIKYFGDFCMYMLRDDFQDYAGLCFKEFGDRVKHWITLNEPLSYVSQGFVRGQSPPGRCSSWQQLNCTSGDSGTEPYLAAHNQLLAHALAVKVYKQKYQVPSTKFFLR